MVTQATQPNPGGVYSAPTPRMRTGLPPGTFTPVGTFTPGGAGANGAAPQPFYKRWWFWGIVGAVGLSGLVVTGGVVGFVLLRKRKGKRRKR